MSGNESSGSEDSNSSAWNRMEENIQAGVNERMQLQQQITDFTAATREQHGVVTAQLGEIIAALGAANHPMRLGGAAAIAAGSVDVLLGGGAIGAPVLGFEQGHGDAVPAGARAGLGLANPPPAMHGDVQGGAGGWGGAEQQLTTQERHMKKLKFNARATAWGDNVRRALWLISGGFPPALNQNVLRSAMNNAIDLSPPVVNALLTFRDFDVTDFTHRGATGSPLALPTHLRLLGGALVTLLQRSMPDNAEAAAGARARVGDLGRAFGAAAGALDTHCRDNYKAIQQDHNRRIITKLLNRDIEAYFQSVLRFAEDLTRTNFFPPDGLVAAPPAPTFSFLYAYINTGGLINSTVAAGKDVGRGGSAGGGAGGSGSSGAGGRTTAKPRGACREWSRKGSCRWGTRCFYTHVVAGDKRKSDTAAGCGGGGTKDGSNNGNGAGGGGSGSGGSGGGGSGSGGGASAGTSAPAAKKSKKTTVASGTRSGGGKNTGADSDDE